MHGNFTLLIANTGELYQLKPVFYGNTSMLEILYVGNRDYFFIIYIHISQRAGLALLD